MSESESKATTKSSKATKAEGETVAKKKTARKVEPTAASSRPPRTHRKPNRFDFGAEEKTLTSKRKRAASKERSPAPKKKRRSVSKSPSRSSRKSKSPKKGKKKDPNAPKKALSAYMFFAQANRDKVKKENPDATFGELGKHLGKLWSKASKSDKAKYEAKANKDKERYEKEKAKYDKNHQSSDEEESSD